MDDLTDRQKREIEYHQEHAALHNQKQNNPVSLDVALSEQRRWWNAYWRIYDILRTYELQNLNILVPGCGFGDDAVRLSILGGNVFACDISPDVIQIADNRCKQFEYKNIDFKVCPCEALPYEDSFFDVIFCCDILHHVDIAATVTEFKRVAKPNCKLIGDELYTHRILEVVRRNRFVDNIIYPAMTKYIYGPSKPYITEDEHKIDETEFRLVTNEMSSFKMEYFNFMVGRLIPDRSRTLSKIDRTVIKAMGSIGSILAGRILFEGTIRK